MGFMAVIPMIISAAAAVAGGVAASNAAEYQSKVAQQNAQIAEQKKQMELQAGADQASKAAMQEKAQAGSIKAAQAAGGLDVNSGSTVGVQTGQAQVSMMDQLAIASDTKKKAWGQDISATSFRNQSKLYSMEASNSLIVGGLKAAGSMAGSYNSLDQNYGFFK